MKITAIILLCLILKIKAFAFAKEGKTVQHADFSLEKKFVELKRSRLCKNPVGDQRCCRLENKELLRMEVLPGTGWDDLRNMNMGIVIQRNYSQCLTSEDGKYLIPDKTYVVALKESNVVLKSEYFDHWNNYSSMTSNSINLEAHVSIFGFGLGGKFSSEHESVKRHQVEDKAVTTRVQLRYKFYTIKAQPDMQLHPDFKSRLLDIAANLQCNNTAMARYMADLLVRDYGTHYVTSIDAGAILAKVDYVKSKYSSSLESNKRKLTASATASFFGMFGSSVGPSYKNKASKKDLDIYKNNVVQSKIYTYGGPPYRANFSISQWEDGLTNNLVATDRSGDLLHFAIKPHVLPELPKVLTRRLSLFVFKSIKSYYKHNSIKGCTDASSPNFNFEAVLDDHSCEAPYTNFTFGGVYQTCSVSGSPTGNPCSAFQQKNPKKNDYACPDGYSAVLIHQGRTPTTCHKQVCHGWWIFKSCDPAKCGHATHNTFWCAAKGPVRDHSGYLFGGLYNKVTKNPITGTRTCPPKFYPQRFGPEGMYVCISDDYELAARYRLSFAGFFSCSEGNPLALDNTTALAFALGSTPQPKAGHHSWPKRCPTGYSQHLAIIDENCEINYCVNANSLSVQGLPTIKRPPFRSLPKMNHNITVPLAIFNDDTGKVWYKEPKSLNWVSPEKDKLLKFMSDKHIDKGVFKNITIFVERFKPNAKSSSSSDSARGPTSAFAIAIGLLAFTAIAIIVKVFVQRPKRRSLYTRLWPSLDYQPKENELVEKIKV